MTPGTDKRCANCGYSVAADWVVCGKCGTPMPEPSTTRTDLARCRVCGALLPLVDAVPTDRQEGETWMTWAWAHPACLLGVTDA